MSLRIFTTFVLALCLPWIANAQTDEGPAKKSSPTRVVTTTISSMASAYEGSQFRDRVNAVMEKHLGPAEGFESIAPVIAFCEGKLADDSKQHFSVQNDDEARELLSLYPGKPIELLDWACPGAYKAGAFLAIEEKDFPKAFAFLDKAEAIAPQLAEPLVERGYLQTRTGNPAAGIASYRRALALIETHPGSADMKATALRGLGFSLIEAGDLPAARVAYEQSLVVEPGNKLALSELDYLSKLEGSSATPAGAEPAPAKVSP